MKVRTIEEADRALVAMGTALCMVRPDVTDQIIEIVEALQRGVPRADEARALAKNMWARVA